MSTPTHPEVLWAQRSSTSEPEKNVVFLTVNLPDIQEPTLKYDLTPTTISVSTMAGSASQGLTEKKYEFKLDLFAEVVPELSTQRLTTRSLYLILRKKENKAEFWTRLTKEKIKSNFIKTDFSKWVDEDEQDGEAAKVVEEDDGMGGMGGMGGGMPPGMGGMGGMANMMGGMGGGMPGMEGMDLEKMMAAMGGGGGGMPPGMGGSSGGDEEDGDDSDDDGPPPLEEAEPAK